MVKRVKQLLSVCVNIVCVCQCVPAEAAVGGGGRLAEFLRHAAAAQTGLQRQGGSGLQHRGGGQ